MKIDKKKGFRENVGRKKKYGEESAIECFRVPEGKKHDYRDWDQIKDFANRFGELLNK